MKYDEIVIGSSLRAVMYAFVHQLPLFFAEVRRPFRFEFLPPDLDLTSIKINNEARTLKTHSDDLLVGLPKEILWEKMTFLLSLRGNLPLSNLCHSMRHANEKIICSNEYSKMVEIEFNKCYYFGDDRLPHFLEQKSVASDEIMCYDYIAFNRGGKFDIDYIETDDDFVKQIWFYPSDRIDGNSGVKDACAVSTLTRDLLADFDYSETMARFKTIHEMEKRGMKGRFNGYCPKYGHPKHYKFRTSYITRTIRRKDERIWHETDKIKNPQLAEEDLFALIPSACLAYDRLLSDASSGNYTSRWAQKRLQA